MPKLPDVNAFGDRPLPRPATGVATYNPVVGSEASLGQAAVNLGQSFAVIAHELDKEQQNVDTLAAEDAMTTLRASSMDMTSGTEGFRMVLGKDAVDGKLLQKYNKLFDQQVDEIGKTLANKNQRALFNRRVGIVMLQYKNDLLAHVAQQKQEYADAVYSNGVRVETESAIDRWHDPAGIALSVTRINGLVNQEADRKGWDADTVAAMRSGAVSKVHVGVIERMLANDADLMAAEYYKANQDAVAGTDKAAVEKALADGSLRGASQRQTDAMLAKYPDRGAFMKAAKAIKDPKLRDAVEERGNRYFSVNEQAERENQDNVFTNAATSLEQSRGDIDALRKNPGIWNTITLDHRKALEARAKQLVSGVEPGTDWQRYYDLKTLGATPATRPQFMKMNLYLERPKLADAEFKELVNLQSALRDGKTDKLDGYRTTKQIVDDSLAGASIDPTPKPGSTAAQRVANFRSQIDARIADEQRRLGRELTNTETQGIVDTMLIEGKVKGTGILGFFPTRRRAFEVKLGEEVVVEYDAIPDAEKTKIVDALKRRGVKATEDKVLELYNLKLERARGQ